MGQKEELEELPQVDGPGSGMCVRVRLFYPASAESFVHMCAHSWVVMSLDSCRWPQPWAQPAHL